MVISREYIRGVRSTMHPTGFQNALLLLGVAVVLIALFRAVRLPQVLAYLAAGVLVGPHGLSVLPETTEWRYLAEFGLVFLMFTIGLEFSWPRLAAMKTIVFGLGPAQVLTGCAVFGGAAWGLGVAPEGAIVVGAMLAMSSTAIVLKLLVEQLEHNSRHGRHAIGILLFQDLAVVPFLILIPALVGDGRSVPLALGMALVKSVALLGVVAFVGGRLLRPLLHAVAQARLREYFMLSVLLLTLTAAWLTEAAGLSLAPGAFLAGMLLGETEYRHQVEADIQPFRDLLLGLFFVTVGTLLDVDVIARNAPLVLGAVVAVLAFKTVSIAALGKLFGLETGVALRTGLVMSQGGEFGFALLLLASQYALLDARTTQIVLAVVVLTMLVAPVIVRYNGMVVTRLVPGYMRERAANIEVIQREARAARKHVIICGYGRSGQNLAWMLEQEGIPSFALDLDPVRVRDARDAGKPVVYGDSGRHDALEAAGLARASALAVSFHDVALALRILAIVRRERPDMPVIVRTKDDVDLERLMAAGATEVVPEALEGSLMMGSHMLLLLGVPVTRIVRHVRDVRADRYRMLRGFFHGQAMFGEDQGEAYRERLHSVVLPPAAFAVGRTLGELGLDELGVTVNAVRRDHAPRIRPAPQVHPRAGDILVLYGAPEALEAAERRLLHG